MAKIYGIRNIGKHILEIYDDVPAWSLEDEGRLIYVKSDNNLYYASRSGWYANIGESGISGYSGKPGFSGYSGCSGYSGYSGRAESGYSGYSGNSPDWVGTEMMDVSNINKGFFILPNGLIINYGYRAFGTTEPVRRYVIPYSKNYTTDAIFSSITVVRKPATDTTYNIFPGTRNAGNTSSYIISQNLDNPEALRQTINIVFDQNLLLTHRFSGFYWLSIGF